MLEAPSPTALRMDPTEQLVKALEKVTPVSRILKFLPKVATVMLNGSLRNLGKFLVLTPGRSRTSSCTSRDVLRARGVGLLGWRIWKIDFVMR